MRTLLAAACAQRSCAVWPIHVSALSRDARTRRRGADLVWSTPALGQSRHVGARLGQRADTGCRADVAPEQWRPHHALRADDIALKLVVTGDGLLAQQVRQTLAANRRLGTRRPIKQVANLTGVRNEKSFMRPFMTWTGQSPEHLKQYRQDSANQTS